MLVFSAVWWHETYTETQKYYISRWIAENAALLRAFSTEALRFINSSSDTGAVVSNESILEMT